jgi:hypothetical protein
MVHLVIGFKTPKPTAPVVLYCGLDGSAAQDAVYATPPKGIIRCEWHKCQQPVKRHFYLDPAGANGSPLPSLRRKPS